MLDLNSSVVIFYIRDSDDRELNLHILLDFYYKHFNNFQMLLVEQPLDTTFSCSNYKHIQHIVLGGDIPNKNLAYNEGIKAATHENMIFNDVDVIFDPDNIAECLNIINSDKNIHFTQPSDGHSINIFANARDKFKTNLDIEYLKSLIDRNKYNVSNHTNANTKVCNVTAPGGGYVCNKSELIKMNGFNPGFKGWGWEDAETILRFEKMGNPLKRLRGFKPMFHIDHKNAVRGGNKFVTDNKDMFEFVKSIKLEDISEYSHKTWLL